MKNREVSIVTGWGDHLGTGHLQRMANLADFINRESSFRAFLICGRKPAFLPDSLHDYFSERIRPECGLIIRDMRNSGIVEMKGLKGLCRVIAVDDCGPGREMADCPIDLLPNLTYAINKKELFIYGYTFTDSIRRLGNHPVRKDIDYALYCGISPSRETVDSLLTLIPDNRSCAILAGSDSRVIKKGTIKPLQKSYAETLLSARVLISHFGITLYEGHIAGCRLVSINPTGYHSQLADIAKHDLGLTNLGILDAVDHDQARSVVSESCLNALADMIIPAAINKKIEKGLELFLTRIQAYLH